MATVTSQDGTSIAYDRSGQGPALILVLGAFNERATGAPLARVMAEHFTVFNYDRRGRGDSGDTQPYAIEREIEDLAALIVAAGGSAFVFGYSSGAILALRAAAHGLPISRLALYEPAPIGGRAGAVAAQLRELVAAGRRGDAVELFQSDMVGIPPAVVAQLRTAPFRPALERLAPTLVYECLLLESLPAGLLTAVRQATLVVDGGESPPVLRQTAQSIADALPAGRYTTLPNQTHDLAPDALEPVLANFLLAPT